MLDQQVESSPSDIAIVGMALRVPGARNVGEFWQNLVSGTESIRTLTAEELAEAGESPDRMHDPNYVRRTADLPDMEMFDAEFFGLSPKEAAIMDPQHRHFLECTWEAMEDAGRMPDSIDGPVGVFAGCGMGSYFYFNVCSNRQLVDQVGMFLLRHTGNDKDFLSTRASFTFDLRGPSVNVQTACSTSLVAVHYACQSLLNGECDMALAGGVTIEMPHRRGYAFQEGEILSPDGHCRPFDHRAAGTVFGSGVGVVVLRRLKDAIADGDVIHAVIKSSAINNDGGTKAGYLAPSVSGQAEAIIEAQGLGGIDADTIQYVECHGTGTFLGDPIEIEALTQAFRQSTDKVGYCKVGSVKSNIGHLDTAAGVVGLIKTSLAIRHGEIPPTLGFEKPNPSIDFANSPFSVASSLTRWPRVEGRRRAAVNSLGVGGTNAHIIVEEAPIRRDDRAAAQDPVLFYLSGKQRKAVRDAAERLSARLAAEPNLPLADVAHTLLTGRRKFEYGMVVAGRDRADAIAALVDPKRQVAQDLVDKPSGAAFLFPGGGAQYAGMASVLYAENPTLRATVDEGLSYLDERAAAEVRAAWFADRVSGSTDFLRPSVQLPAITILEVAIARAWIDAGVRPKALIGHSMGENAAACVAGVMTFRDVVRLVRLRGELFDTVEPGGMLSIPMGEEELASLMPPELDVASLNAPGLSVVSGRDADLETFRKFLEERGVEASRVPINIAAHSRMLEPILPRWEAFLRSIPLKSPSIPIMSNRTGTWLTAAEATDPRYWVDHLRSTVHFAKGMNTLSADGGLVYIEVGPGRALSSLTKAQGTVDAGRVINSLPHPDEGTDDRLHLLAAFGRAWVAGLPVDTALFKGGPDARRVELPSYPFQHRRYFIDAVAPSAVADGQAIVVKEPDLDRWGYRRIWKRSVADYRDDRPSAPETWLFFVDETGRGQRMAARLRALGHRVVTVSLGDIFMRRGEDDYLLCPESGRSGYEALVSGLVADGAMPTRIAHMWLVTGSERFRAGSNFFHRNLECGFYSLLHLFQAMGDVGVPDALHVTVVTNGMQRVGDEALPYPEKSTVLGPAMVIPKEFPGTTVSVVDGEFLNEEPMTSKRRRGAPEPIGTADDLLWEDLLAAPNSDIVALRKGRRSSWSYERMAFDDVEGGLGLLKEKGVYLFTGGLGGIALALAGSLASRLKARLVLVGRTPLPPREEWDAYARTHRLDATRRAIAAVRALEERGAEVLHLSADVTNPEEMGRAVKAAVTRFGGIDGVFHTAGRVDDGLVLEKREESIEQVLAPKILGTNVLEDALKDVPIDLMVLFSSTSTDTAPAGQADYVAANAYLNAFAESRDRQPGRRTIALHWGIWNEVGIAARAVAGTKELAFIPSERPAAGPLFQRFVEDDKGTTWLEMDVAAKREWFLDEHRLLSGQAILPGSAYIELIAQAAREYGLSGTPAIEDLIFLKPLAVADGETRTIRINLEETARGHRLMVTAGNADEGYETHAECIVTTTSSVRPAFDKAAALKQVSRVRQAEAGHALRSPQEDHIRFGPRWQVLRSVALGRDEAFAELSLDERFRGDIAKGSLFHPALLDIGTGFAIELVSDFGRSDVLWAPMSYGRAVLHAPLPAEVVSAIKLVGSDYGDGYAAFDVVIADREGSVVFEARQFLMKRLDSDTQLAAPRPHGHADGAGEHAQDRAKLAAQVRQGILPEEGFDALLRALGSKEVQPIVTSMDLERLRQRAAETASAVVANAGFERPDLESEFIAPRNAVEETLASLWQELLGVARVGIHDSFFDLGGHSLIAVRLFRSIRKQYGVDLPISTLFEAPTIAECAALIGVDLPAAGEADETAPKPAEKPKYVHLVAMHAGKDKNATPLFICAGMFGNILNLRHLAVCLGADRPVYGLQARGLYGEMAPHETFEEMAGDYIAEIRSVQPQGPYLLAGYSGGGLVAYEMARQLTEAGQEVGPVVLLDTPQPLQPPLGTADRVTMKLQDIRRHGIGFFRHWLHGKIMWRMHKSKMRAAEATAARPDQLNNERIELAFRRALDRYVVKPYAGQVSLFRPKPQPFYHLGGGRMLQENRNVILADNGWTPHVEQLGIVEVPGDHDSMVLEPYVRVVASHIRDGFKVARPAAGETEAAGPQPFRQAQPASAVREVEAA